MGLEACSCGGHNTFPDCTDKNCLLMLYVIIVPCCVKSCFQHRKSEWVKVTLEQSLETAVQKQASTLDLRNPYMSSGLLFTQNEREQRHLVLTPFINLLISPTSSEMIRSTSSTAQPPPIPKRRGHTASISSDSATLSTPVGRRLDRRLDDEATSKCGLDPRPMTGSNDGRSVVPWQTDDSPSVLAHPDARLSRPTDLGLQDGRPTGTGRCEDKTLSSQFQQRQLPDSSSETAALLEAAEAAALKSSSALAHDAPQWVPPSLAGLSKAEKSGATMTPALTTVGPSSSHEDQVQTASRCYRERRRHTTPQFPITNALLLRQATEAAERLQPVEDENRRPTDSVANPTTGQGVDVGVRPYRQASLQQHTVSIDSRELEWLRAKQRSHRKHLGLLLDLYAY
ncbi:unnamed protein product [Protopolystoma xenopodis]|uniref:Uncharacterized protein n=1 Tax=Protopolystoma xenopodis TaxID=117903 RepID=A0A448XB05_9PLAT|nr:unnamed protein product [Protopolystoma xenopodis]